MSRRLVAAARDAHARGRWDDAYRRLQDARTTAELDGADLALLADAAWWLGRSDESLALYEDLYRLHSREERTPQAARLAVDIGFLWMVRGEPTIGSGWIGRAARLLADTPDCAEQGYLLYLEAEDARRQGALDRALHLTERMHALGVRHDDPTLCAVALVTQGVILVHQGRVAGGLAVLDEAMLPVRAGAVSPSWVGNLYCQLMSLFTDLADVPRARAWTDATERWCDQFSNAAMFLGICRVHRAQLLHLEGDWTAAEERATQACRDLADMNADGVAEGHYVLGELCRLRDDLAGADAAYTRAHELGRDPQPGLALLRLAEGRATAAATSLDTALAAADDRLVRAPLLAARVEVAVATGEPATAAAAARELTEVAEIYDTPGLLAAARLAAGTARLAAAEPERALPLLREACRRWRELDARYEAARARAGLTRALEAVGDREAAARERELAAATFVALGAAQDLRVLGDEGEPPGGLTAREAEVLRLVATGRSNREIAAELTISDRTVERHLTNIFLKLDVGSRTEAARFAFGHGLADPTG